MQDLILDHQAQKTGIQSLNHQTTRLTKLRSRFFSVVFCSIKIKIPEASAVLQSAHGGCMHYLFHMIKWNGSLCLIYTNI